MSKGKGKALPAAVDDKFESQWKLLADAFDKVVEIVESGFKITHQDKIQDKMWAYARCYDLCTANDTGAKNPGVATNSPPAKKIYDRTKKMIEDYLSERVTSDVSSKTGEALLTEVYTRWDHHQIVVRWCRIMFSYLDQFYTKTSGVDPLRIMMLKCFNSAVYEKIKSALSDIVLEQIRKERQGTEINRTVIKEAIGLFVEMGMDSITIYEKDFQTRFLTDTADYYKRLASAWLNEAGGNRTYLKRVEKCLADEDYRALSYLHSSTRPLLITCVETELLTNYQMSILEDGDCGVEALLENWKTDELTRMYTLFKRIPKGLDPMSAILRDFIKKEGKLANKKFCDGDFDGNQYIDACLELHDKYSKLFRECFEDNNIFHKARKEAFEVFVNESLMPTKGENPVKTTISELLSTHCDNLMKNEKMTPDELEEKLDKVVCLFTYISDKDLFQEFYRKQMSKRLLVSKTDNDNEKQLISKLKMKMGGPYTSKLEGMITDKGVSAETQKKFEEWIQKRQISMSIDFSVQVLTTGFWPAYKVDSINLPKELNDHLDYFQQYYSANTQSRLLKWVHSLGTATVFTKFKSGPKEMMTSTYQACVLCLFNKDASITTSAIVTELGLPLEEVKRALHSMVFGKFPILKKEDKKSKNIVEADAFSVNEEFTSPQRKFKIPNVVKASSEAVVKETDENRRHVIEACIVRTMKSRKQMTNNELQAECIRQLSTYFKPDPKAIKKRIEDLIERAYLERDENDRNIYRYLA